MEKTARTKLATQQRWKQNILTVVVGCILISAYGVTKHSVDKRLATRKSQEDIRYVPNPTLLRFLSFGFEPAMADVTWIEAVNYFGSQLLTKKRTYQYLAQYCDLILNLDPLFRVFYEWSGTAFIYNGLPIDKKAIVQSTVYVNLGIQKFHEHYLYDSQMILKGAFNYAMEAKNYVASTAYYAMAARIFSDQRDMLLVASSMASYANNTDLSTELKMEYLGLMAFEAQTREQLMYAVRVLSSANFNTQSANMIKAMRLRMETDEDIRRVVENRLNTQPLFTDDTKSKALVLGGDRRLDNTMNVDFTRTWMPSELLTLFSI